MKKFVTLAGIYMAVSVVVIFSSCTKKLDLQPTNDITSEKVYSSVAGYESVIAKVYAAFALTGNEGPAGNGDVLINDGGGNLVHV